MPSISYKHGLVAAAFAVLAVVPATIAQEPSAEAGRALYVATCSGCHAEGGEGGYGPPLVSNNFVASPANMIGQILNPRELMPSFRHLSDEDIATIVNFVRMVFNDYDDAIDAAFVAAQR